MSPVIASLAPYYPDIIKQLPSIFTAHEFIQKLTQQHQTHYIEALYYYKGEAEPFTTVQRMLGQQLLDFENLINKIGDVSSKNLFNNDSTVSQWEKL